MKQSQHIVSTADGTVDAVLAHVGAAKAALPVSTRDVADGLTAYFSALPAEHDGDTPFTFEVHFSEAFSISYLAMPGAFEVTNGSATGAGRVDNPHDEAQGLQANKVWAITVQPDGAGDVGIELPATTDCEASGAVCTDGGKALAGSVEARIAGPVAISVADASVTEGADAVLAFEVTLDRAPSAPVTVDYATGEGEATPDDDYVETSGTLTFAPAETSKTVNVEVLEDSHDEGSETMRLTLANATGARIADGTAIGAIENSEGSGARRDRAFRHEAEPQERCDVGRDEERPLGRHGGDARRCPAAAAGGAGRARLRPRRTGDARAKR